MTSNHEADASAPWACRIPPRVRRAFDRLGIAEPADLRRIREVDLLLLPGFGWKSLVAAHRIAEHHGVVIGQANATRDKPA